MSNNTLQLWFISASGPRTVVHPKARIIAEAGPIVIGEGNLIEEQALIINRWAISVHSVYCVLCVTNKQMLVHAAILRTFCLTVTVWNPKSWPLASITSLKLAVVHFYLIELLEWLEAWSFYLCQIQLELIFYIFQYLRLWKLGITMLSNQKVSDN